MPVVGIDSAQIDQRASYFREHIRQQIASRSMVPLGLVFHERVPILIAHVYFALSQAYKRKYLKDGNRTDMPKRAAMTCAAISVVDPIRPPIGVVEIDKEEYLYVNQMLAMRVASAMVRHPFVKRPFDDQRRVYRSIAELEFPSVDPILQEARDHNGEIQTDWSIELTSDEEAKINLLIEQFSLYMHFRIPEQSGR